ncbi:heme-binding protein [Neorhizobium sp. NCHU2750]|uniref:GlcG/HbpS family heme-binding protein n=1 Tax=Neorhizobium sp. NCHU2750 TaxID=1825976 RepID=UPI000E72337B|nr:membrane protein [Neorhizobium sp. NCHU2750]
MTDTHFLNRPALTSSGAQALVDRAVAIAKAKNIAIAASVVDAGGNLMAFLRMDGVPSVSCDVAIGKARTAAALGAPSEIFETMINKGETAMLSVAGLYPLKGGVPILEGGDLAGAVGISGSSGENDMAVADETAASFAIQGGFKVA